MSLESTPPPASPIRIEVLAPPGVRRRRQRLVMLLLTALILGAGGWAWSKGYLSDRLWRRSAAAMEVVEVDKGDLPFYVVESGTLESANNTTVKCKVEALIGLVGGAQQGQPGRPGAPGQQQGQNSLTQLGGNVANAQGQNAQQQQQQQQQAKAKKGGVGKKGAMPAKGKTGAAAKTPGATGAAGTTGATGTQAAGASGGAGGMSGAQGGAGGSGGSGGAGGAAGGASANTAGSTMTVTKAPMLNSFQFMVEPYMSLRPPGQNPAQQKKAQPQQQQQGGPGGGRGGGGRGGGGRGGGPGGEEERPGSTRIIWIAPEGTIVHAGDVVCELDSAAFKDELQAQKIRYLQAKAWVDQARSMLEVNQIALREYRDGILPQDKLVVQRHLETCATEYERFKNNLEWSQTTFKKGYRAATQVQADVLAFERAEIALKEARNMEERLEKYTGPKIVKTLEAKIAANRADLLAQQSAFQLESDRLRKLQTLVDNCTMRAPRDGIVVYANQSNSWGRTEAQVQEGATVREGQPIFNLPDPKHMRVKAKINESKVSFVRTGQRAEVRVDAFPDQPLRGTVAEVTAIPAPANGPVSDIRIYYAMVDIDDVGTNELRPGLSAEVSFFIENHHEVTRVPVQAIRWQDDKPYAAVAAEKGFRWRPIEVGLMNAAYAEVLSGLQPGDRVAANPDALPPPVRVLPSPHTTVAELSR